jgi:hypothetical protein
MFFDTRQSVRKKYSAKNPLAIKCLPSIFGKDFTEYKIVFAECLRYSAKNTIPVVQIPMSHGNQKKQAVQIPMRHENQKQAVPFHAGTKTSDSDNTKQSAHVVSVTLHKRPDETRAGSSCS